MFVIMAVAYVSAIFTQILRTFPQNLNDVAENELKIAKYM